MPKSKRNRPYTLSKTRSKGYELKRTLLQEVVDLLSLSFGLAWEPQDNGEEWYIEKREIVVRECCDKYANIFVYDVANMRNNRLKEIRSLWEDSRFFYGKNRIMQLALGRTEAEEYRDSLYHVAERLHGNVGLLLTNRPQDEVKAWFSKYSCQDFANGGFVALRKVALPVGPLPQFPHSMEPQLRKLGMPTALKKGVVTLESEHVVCREGDVLTPEQARILKLFDVKMSQFKIRLVASWAQSGTYEDIAQDTVQD